MSEINVRINLYSVKMAFCNNCDFYKKKLMTYYMNFSENFFHDILDQFFKSSIQTYSLRERNYQVCHGFFLNHSYCNKPFNSINIDCCKIKQRVKMQTSTRFNYQ